MTPQQSLKGTAAPGELRPQQELHEQAVAHGGPHQNTEKKREEGTEEKSKEQGVAERNHYTLDPNVLCCLCLPQELSVICGNTNSKIIGRVGTYFP